MISYFEKQPEETQQWHQLPLIIIKFDALTMDLGVTV